MIYLDHAATSPMPPAVAQAYATALTTVGNPSSLHSAGQRARAVLDDARARIASTLGVEPIELTLTGGGTEAVNTAVKGLYWARVANRTRPRVLVPRAEHHATLDAVYWLAEHEGAEIVWLEVDELGRLSLDSVATALGDGHDVALVSLLWANNEVGTLQPVAAVAALAAAVGVPVHVDAIAAYGQVPLAPLPVGISALSISAHKLGGPVGVGALVLRRTAEIVPLLHGGTQQRGRSGTMDAAGAVAFAVAAERAHEAIAANAAHKRSLRDRLAAGVRHRVPSVVVRGAMGARERTRDDREAEGFEALALPGTLHLTVPGAEGDSLLMLLDAAGIAVSTGSACQAGVPEPSHVLLAMGLSAEDARGALRMTIGPDTTADDIDGLLAALPMAVERAQAAGLAARTPRLGR